MHIQSVHQHFIDGNRMNGFLNKYRAKVNGRAKKKIKLYEQENIRSTVYMDIIDNALEVIKERCAEELYNETLSHSKE